jgi:cysteinyl-tRNA synthetase
MLRVTNTLTRRKEQIVPLEPGRVSMYSCGPTVYRYAHVGNLRTFILSDLVRRVLEYHGLEVTLVMNITDVGHMTDELRDAGQDKMLLAAQDEGKTAAEIASFYADAFFRDIDAVNIKRASAYPRASDHIGDMLGLITKLFEAGHAYEDGGTVYYDVTSFPGYGRLSGQSPDDVRAGHRIANADHHKRHHQDFVLWKAAGPRRVVVFDSPWGRGYPGWHIECSAMSMRYLGERFDVHTGGVDLRFPHHEGEIAQSEGVVGHEVVSMWIHGDHLLMGKLKMAKSSGNVLTIQDLMADGHDPLAFRYLCYTARYRRQIGFSDEALSGAGTALRRLRRKLAALAQDAGTIAAAPTDEALRASVNEPAALSYHDRFVNAVDDDLDFPEAVKTLQEAVDDDKVPPRARLALALSWDHVLALDLGPREERLDDECAGLLRQREEARTAKDFARADALRDTLRGHGVEVTDTPSGPRWTRVT